MSLPPPQVPRPPRGEPGPLSPVDPNELQPPARAAYEAAPSPTERPIAPASEGPVGEPLDEGEASYQRYREEDRSIGEIASDVLDNASTLLRQEVELAKAEIKESAKRAGKGAGLLTGAGIAALLTLIALTLTGWWAIGVAIGSETQPALGWSGLIVTGIWLVIAIILALVGRKDLQSVEGIPQTQETVKKIPNAVKGNEERNR